MSSHTNYPFGGPPSFGRPPTNSNNNNNSSSSSNAAPVAESPSPVESELFADIDVIICGIKEDIGAFLSSLQQYARKRGDGASVGLSAALDVRYHLQGQQDLDGCLQFIRTHGRDMEEFAKGVFAGDAARWKEDEVGKSEESVLLEEEGGSVTGDKDDAGEEEMLAEESELADLEEDGENYVVSEEDTARVQWMEAHEAMEVAQRLETVQDNILRDIPMLSEEERAHKTTLWHEMIGDHWYELVKTRLKGERYW
ncbi:hypothetical protein MBLNU13_g05220t1 [Cladosporium sp. NU13]